MENWIIYAIIAVAGIGALGSGIVCRRQSRQLTMLLVCMAVGEGMLFYLGEREYWSFAECLATGLLGGLFVVLIANRLRRRDY